MTYDDDLRLAFANTIVHPDNRRLRLLNEDNASVRETNLEEAVRSGETYMLTPSRGLLVLDEDHTWDVSVNVVRSAAIDKLVECAEESGLKYVVVDSGRKGHRHLYLVFGVNRASRILREDAADWARTQGLDVRDHGIRPPGSPHRLTDHAPATVIGDASEALAALETCGSGAPTQTPRRFVAALRGRCLSAEVLSATVSEDGTGDGRYLSTSNTRMALATGLFSMGSTRDVLDRLLNNHGLPCARTLNRLSADGRQREIDRMWGKATVWVGQRDARTREPQVEQWANAINRHPWKGQAGGTDHAMAQALADVAQRTKKVEIGLSKRAAALKIGVTPVTAAISLSRLVTAGWLKVIRQHTATTARVFRLCIPADAQPAEALNEAAPAAGPEWNPAHDAGRWRALGKSTLRVGALVAASRRLGVATLAEWLSTSRRSALHHLGKLVRAGLVRRDDNTHEFVLTASTPSELKAQLAACAVEAGTAGAGDRQRARDEQERRARAERLELIGCGLERHPGVRG